MRGRGRSGDGGGEGHENMIRARHETDKIKQGRADEWISGSKREMEER